MRTATRASCNPCFRELASELPGGEEIQSTHSVIYVEVCDFILHRLNYNTVALVYTFRV